ncbi:MAG: M1 family metallopeptidase [Phycisphaerales bacterium]|nr:M1 family metallopeptidase [Phycisphaerales bacterium]
MKSLLAFILIGITLAAPLACSPKPPMRQPAARPTTTIFTELDLPTPNAIRTMTGHPGPAYWQQQVDYIIDVELEPETNMITGHAQITYVNNSPQQLKYLWIHLEQNLMRQDSLGVRSGRRRVQDFTEGIVIDSLSQNGEALQYAVHDTLGRVELPTPVKANGGRITFDVHWHFEVLDGDTPRFGLEKVEQGKVYEIAQWFPAVAVFNDVYGWNTLPYIGGGEFYTDFGDYKVSITAPREYIVVATGVLQNEDEVFTPQQIERLAKARSSSETIMIRSEEEVSDPASRPSGEGDLTWHFKADDVRTFAWAASDAFIYDACSLDETFISSAYPKEALPLWEDSTQMLRTAIVGYNKQWYPYPYPTATNVSGSEGGMEYPMIIFCRGRSTERGLYGVTTHEIGHNWFPMIVNTDERRHAWMDEGFNTFINYYSFGDWFEGKEGRRGNADSFARKMVRTEMVPLATYPDRSPGRIRGTLFYEKPSVGLVMLREHILGPDRFDPAFREYIETWAFKSPQPADFYRIMENSSGEDLAWFWRGWFMETSMLDQELVDVSSKQQEDGTISTTITVDNLNELVMPADLKMTFADGTTMIRRIPVQAWYLSDRNTQKVNHKSRLISVELDAEKDFPDIDRSNNRWNASHLPVK